MTNKNHQNSSNDPDNCQNIKELIVQAGEHLKSGDIEAAARVSGEAYERAPNDPECALQLSEILTVQGKIELTIDTLKRSVDLGARHADLTERLLKLLVETGNYDDAIDYSKMLLPDDPRNVFIRDIMGMACLQQGKLDEALENTEELISLDPTDPVHHFKKAVILQQQGAVAKAMDSFNRAIELDTQGEISDEAHQAIASLDGFQLRQILTIAIEDAVFNAKLRHDPVSALGEKGFMLSPGGLSILNQMDLTNLPAEAEYRHYN